MHDKAVRRRRAVLVVLVAASLILLTAYFGESSDGRLHSVQRAALGVTRRRSRRAPAASSSRSANLRVVRRHGRRPGPARPIIEERDTSRTRSWTLRSPRAGRAAPKLIKENARRRGHEPTGRSTRASLSARPTAGTSGSRSTRAQRRRPRGDPVINGAGLVGKVAETVKGMRVSCWSPTRASHGRDHRRNAAIRAPSLPPSGRPAT